VDDKAAPADDREAWTRAAKGIVVLDARTSLARQEGSAPTNFQLVTQKRTYQLCAASTVDMDEWLVALKKNLGVLRKRESAARPSGRRASAVGGGGSGGGGSGGSGGGGGGSGPAAAAGTDPGQAAIEKANRLLHSMGNSTPRGVGTALAGVPMPPPPPPEAAEAALGIVAPSTAARRQSISRPGRKPPPPPPGSQSANV
jgi:hypothetical protein